MVQDRGGAEFRTGGILLYVEDLERSTNKDIGPKDIFEMGSKYCAATHALFVEYGLAAPFTDPQPAVSALCDIPALFPGSSFQATEPQFFSVFISFVLIASALNRRPFLPWFDI